MNEYSGLKVVGIGGAARVGSSTEQALELALLAARNAGASTILFGGAFLVDLPHYISGAVCTTAAQGLLEAVRSADGLILASPSYHGSISGLVKNAIDYLEETAKDDRVYLDGVPVGLITTAFGWQATANTLTALRSIVHALRGWPTPLGAAINTSGDIFSEGECKDLKASAHINLVGRQVCEFARLTRASPKPSVSIVNTC